MTFVGIFGILLGLAALPWAFIERSRLRVAVFAIAYLMHILAAFVYYDYALRSPADSSMYYNDPFHYYDAGFGLSTQFITWFVQTSKLLLGGSYLDYFLVFQGFGFFGIALLMRIMEEIFAELRSPQPLLSYAFLFLPGLHFWTSSIGKDGALFTSVCLAIWASMQLRSRLLQLCVAIVIMLFIRPHIALIGLVALALTFMADRRTPVIYRVLLTFAALAGIVAAVSTLRTTFQIDVTNADSVSDFLAQRETIAQDIDSGTTSVNLPLLLRFPSLLFRPLFFDAEGIFAFVASLESVVALAAVFYLLRHFRSTRRLAKAVTFLRFAAAFVIGVTFLLGLTYFNVGLGLRQRTMIMPGLLALVVALRAWREVQSDARSERAAAALAARRAAAINAPAG